MSVPMKTLTLVVALFFPILLGYGATSAAGQEPRADSSASAVASASTPDQSGQSTDIQTYVGWFLRSSGIIGLFILALTVYFLVTVVRLNSSLRRDVAAPPEQLEHLQEMLRDRDHRGVVAYARANDSYLCRVLTLGVLELPNGLPQAQDAMERHGEVEAVEMENRISMLAVLGTLGPMIGLIGTLKGMIASFSVIATSGVQLRTSEVAGGISEALLLTFEGVALSVPAIYFFAVFRNRVSSISVWTMLHADTLLRQFSSSLRQKSTGTSASGPTSAAA